MQLKKRNQKKFPSISSRTPKNNYLSLNSMLFIDSFNNQAKNDKKIIFYFRVPLTPCLLGYRFD